MKKLIVFFVMCIIAAVCAPSWAGEHAYTSGEKTADAAIMTTSGAFYGIVVMPDGTNDVTVSVYDNASAAAGTELVPTLTFAGDGGAQWFAPPYPIHCFNGIYVDVTVGGGGSVGYSVMMGPGR